MISKGLKKISTLSVVCCRVRLLKAPSKSSAFTIVEIFISLGEIDKNRSLTDENFPFKKVDACIGINKIHYKDSRISSSGCSGRQNDESESEPNKFSQPPARKLGAAVEA